MKNIAFETKLDQNITSSVRDYFELLKPRVMTLVVFSFVAGLVMAPGSLNPLLSLLATIFVSIGSGAAGALNMWYDRDIDSIMLRTKNRPIVKGAIHADEALVFGIILSILSVSGMMVFINITSGLILLASILFYVFIYTIWLKRSTVQNIVIGGAAGAFPPMIGYACKDGVINLESFILFLIIFLWTPPHFWALALYKSDDYQRANVPMMPVIYGADYTKRQIFYYTIIMSISILVPNFINMSGFLYLISAIILSSYFCYLSFKLMIATDIKLAPKTFGYSIIYLFAILGVMMIDKLIF